MRNWRMIVVLICMIVSVRAVVRDAWVFPNHASLPRDIAILAGVVLGGIIVQFGRGNPYIKCIVLLAATIGLGWLGVHSWGHESPLIITLDAILFVWFLYLLISTIRRSMKKHGAPLST